MAKEISDKIIDLFFPKKLKEFLESSDERNPLALLYHRDNRVTRAYLLDILKHLNPVNASTSRDKEIDFYRHVVSSMLPFATYMYTPLTITYATEEEQRAFFAKAMTQFCKKTQQNIQSAIDSQDLNSDPQWEQIKTGFANLATPVGISCLFESAEYIHRATFIFSTGNYIDILRKKEPSLERQTLERFKLMRRSSEINTLHSFLKKIVDSLDHQADRFKSYYEQSVSGVFIMYLIDILKEFQSKIEEDLETKLNFLKSSFHLMIYSLKNITEREATQPTSLQTNVLWHQYHSKISHFISQVNDSFLADEFYAEKPDQAAVEIIKKARPPAKLPYTDQDSSFNNPTTFFAVAYPKKQSASDIYQPGLLDAKSSMLIKFWCTLKILYNFGIGALLYYLKVEPPVPQPQSESIFCSPTSPK